MTSFGVTRTDATRGRSELDADAWPHGRTRTFDDFVPQPSFGPFYEAALSFSADGSEVAFVAGTNERYAIWRQPVRGGPPVRITDGAGWYIHTAFWSPDGRRIAYSAAEGRDEAYQLFVVAPEGGPPRRLTDADGAMHHLTPASFSPDGRLLAYSANDRRPDAVGVSVSDLARGGSRSLIESDGVFHVGSWAPDGRRLVVVEERPAAEVSLLLVDVLTGASERLVEPQSGVTFIPGPWTRDGEAVLVLTNVDAEFIGLAALGVRTRRLEWIAAPSWDVERVLLSRDGSTLAWTVNENGYSRLYARALGDGDARARTDLGARVAPVGEVPEGVIHGLALSHDGRRTALVVSSAARPYDLVVLELGRGRLRRLLGGIPPSLRGIELADAEAVEYTSFDGLPVRGFLTRPRVEAGRFGAVIALHGGPHFQERPNYGFSGLYQYLAHRGLAVFAPNIRGSSGYGASFERLVVRRHGRDDALDVEAAHAFLRSLPWIDPERIGLLGICYGGFVGLAAIVRSPDSWRAIAGWGVPCDLLGLVDSGPPEQREARAALIGDPVRDRDELVDRSPITHADRIRAPVFLIHGRDDIWVPSEQSDRLVRRLRENGVHVEYHAQGGHGFADMESELRACRLTASFLVRHLGLAS